MFRRFGLIYSLFSVVVLLAIVAIGLIRVNTAREARLAESEASFRRFVSEIDELPNDSIGVAAREYVDLIPNLDAIVISGDTAIRYLWARNRETLAFDTSNLEDFRGAIGLDTNEVRQVRLSESTDSRDSRVSVVSAVYTVLTFPDAYPALRDSLIMLVGFAFVTVLVMILVTIAGTPQGQPAMSAQRGNAAERQEQRPARSPEAARPAEPAPERSKAPPVVAATAPEARVVQTRALDAAADRAERQPATGEAQMEEIPIEALDGVSRVPGSIFNPMTGLSYRDFLPKRLASEIDRAAYNDQDISLMIIQFDRLKRPSEEYTTAAQAVLDRYTFEDLCFEYEENSFCVLLPNCELPAAIRSAEEFQATQRSKVHIGVTARNGRLVEADRMLTEATMSLSRAERESGGIVGFQPDPQKYRQFITNSRRSG